MQYVVGEIALKFIVVRCKNRFDKKNKDAKDSGGYRDTQLLVFVKDTLLLLEIQIHLKQFHDAKVKVAANEIGGKTGHERYFEFRILKESYERMKQQN